MAEENTATRVETVTAKIEAVIEKYGDEAYNRIMSVCAMENAISLAMLVDGSNTTEGD